MMKLDKSAPLVIGHPTLTLLLYTVKKMFIYLILFYVLPFLITDLNISYLNFKKNFPFLRQLIPCEPGHYVNTVNVDYADSHF